MKSYVIFILMLLPGISWGQSALSGLVRNERGESLSGASVVWKGTTVWTVSDSLGRFRIPVPAASEKQRELLVSYVGYRADTLRWTPEDQYPVFVLKQDAQLQEVVVRAAGKGLLLSRIDPMHSQRITSAELLRAACCNLSEAFETNPSVDVSYNDAASGAKQIRLLGLSGTYVRMLTENLPDFRGVNSRFGLDYIPGPWMESIQLSKGAASVKNGFESFTGQINVEYKKSEHADPLTLNLYAADNGRMELNADASKRFTDALSSGLFLHYSNDKVSHDDNGDGFLDRPKTEQINLMNRWLYKKDGWVAHWGLGFMSDRRRSGQETMGAEIEHPYEIGIRNHTAQVYTKQGYMFGDEQHSSVALLLSASMTDYRSSYGLRSYNADEQHLYAGLLYESEFTEHHRLSAGLSLQADLLGQQMKGLTLLEGSVPLRHDQWVPGAYLEYTYKPLEHLTLLGGIRADHHTDYGWFFTPRLHLKYDPVSWVNLRASAGKAYRSVDVMNEYNYLLASSRASKWSVQERLPMEQAWNYGMSATFFVPIRGKDMSISAEYYHTRFMAQLVMDNETQSDAISFYALNGRSFSDNLQMELAYPVWKGLEVRAAYRFVYAVMDYKGRLLEKALQSRHKGFMTLSYQTSDPLRKWQFDYTWQWNGGGRMPLADASSPLWKSTFAPYSISNLQASKFFPWGSIYLGAENLFDFKQTDPIVGAADPFGDHFDATMIWGPLHGRTIYLGLRYTLK